MSDQRLACAACGLRYRPSSDFRPGAKCARDGCRGRLGFPIHVTTTADESIRRWKHRASSCETQAKMSARAGRLSLAAFQRGAAAGFLFSAQELAHDLELGSDPVAAPRLDWPLDDETDQRGADMIAKLASALDRNEWAEALTWATTAMRGCADDHGNPTGGQIESWRLLGLLTSIASIARARDDRKRDDDRNGCALDSARTLAHAVLERGAFGAEPSTVRTELEQHARQLLELLGD